MIHTESHEKIKKQNIYLQKVNRPLKGTQSKVTLADIKVFFQSQVHNRVHSEFQPAFHINMSRNYKNLLDTTDLVAFFPFETQSVQS